MKNPFLKLGASAILFFFLFCVSSETMAKGFLKTQGNLNKRLRGEYALTLTSLCAADSEGFGENLERLSIGGTNPVFAVQGKLWYNGNGSGRFEGQQLFMGPTILNPNTFPIRQEGMNCDFTYEVNPDGSFTQEMGSCQSPILAGPNSGTIITQNGIIIKGQIGPWKQTLIFQDTSPNIEIVDRSAIPLPTVNRICGRSGTAVRVPHRFSNNR